MKIEILSEKEARRIGSINFGSCVALDGSYYIISELAIDTNNVYIIDLSSGLKRIISLDTKVRVMDNAKIVIP